MAVITRRKFLGGAGKLTLASGVLPTTLLQFGAASQAAAQVGGEYRALVCILLAGGNDSYNMLLPYDDALYSEYRNIRADLALDQGSLLPLDGNDAQGRRFAVHPGMPELQQLYNDGDAALIANVGPLLETFDAQRVAAGLANLPLGLFSHADQIAHWQTARPDARSPRGWGGRMADSLFNVLPANAVSMNISLSGNNVFQNGELVSEYTIGETDNGAAGIYNYGDVGPYGDLRRKTIDSLLAIENSHLLKREYLRRMQNSINAQLVFDEAMQSAANLATGFSDNPLSARLRQIARVISVHQALGATRQTFFVEIGGWDHHDELLNNHARMLPGVSTALREFADALKEISMFDQVATFTISDFGRTLTSNGRGSDHGWGGHHIVMGGGVQGGTIYGEYPALSANNPLDVGRGIYAPTTATDEYFAELALWLGVAPADLTQVLPNIGSFYDVQSGQAPMGFL